MKLNVLQKFTFLSIVVTIVLAVALGLLVSVILTRGLLSREAEVTAEAVWSVTNVDLPREVFIRAVRERDFATFEHLWRHFRQIHEVFRLKIYDPQGRIVWSDESHLIGKFYPDDQELQRALRGKVAVQMGEAKGEHEYEKGLVPEDEILEMYVPLTCPGDESVYGVIDIYTHPVAFLASKRAWLKVLWGATLGSGLFLFFSLFGIFRSALREQNRLHNAERQLLEQSVETAGAGLRVLDRRLQPHWRSALWDAWFGRRSPRSRALEELNRLGAAALEHRAGAQAVVTEIELPGSDGEPVERPRRILQVTTAPLLDAAGNVTQVIQLAQDVTQQKRGQAAMMRAGQLAAVGELAGQVAHEVNNPIAIISAKARLLLMDHRQEMSGKVAEEMQKITDLSDRVARIAQGLLFYSRPSSGIRSPLDLRVPIHRALTMAADRARLSNVAVADALPPQLPPVVANAHEMEQVFLNLFLNALDAMPQGGRLSVTAESSVLPLAQGGTAPAIAIAVEDTGRGVPAELRERIFEPFFTTKGESQGTGLGLSICLGIIRSHGGQVTLESHAPHGARFVVRLPALGQTEEKEVTHGQGAHSGRG